MVFAMATITIIKKRSETTKNVKFNMSTDCDITYLPTSIQELTETYFEYQTHSIGLK